MMFDRLALQAAAKSALKAGEQGHERRHQQELEKYGEAKDAWLEEHRDAWLAALPKLRDKLRKGRPVTDDDLPKSGGGWASTFRYRPPGRRPYEGGHALRALVRVLDTVADEKVSSYGLTELGVTRDALRAAVAHMGKGEVRA